MYVVYKEHTETTCMRMKLILLKYSQAPVQFKGMCNITKKKHAALIVQKYFTIEDVHAWYN